MRYNLHTQTSPLIEPCVCPITGEPTLSAAFERINNGAFDSGDTSMWITSNWTFGLDAAATSTAGTLHQVFPQNISSGRPFTLSFYKSGSRILRVSLYLDTTPTQTLFENADPSEGTVEVTGTTSGLFNRIYLEITNPNGLFNSVDDLSLIV